MNIEDRIFELSGEKTMGTEIVDVIVDEYEVDRETAWDLVISVRRERRTPQRIETKEAIDRLSRLSFI